MSASREKKIRQEGGPLTEKRRQEQESAAAAKRKRTLYLVIGIVVAVAVVALLVWDSGLIQRGQTAATVGGEDFTVADVSYYYYRTKNNFINNVQAMQQQYGFDMGYDTTKTPAEQTYSTDSETGEVTTYADYFRESALNSLQQTMALVNAAKAEGYTLSADGQATIDTQNQELDQMAGQYGTSRLSILRQNYGPYITEEVFARNLERTALASDYLTTYQNNVDTSESAMKAYYQDHKDTLDSFTYRYAYIDGQPATKTDDEGKTVAATDEEKAAALNAAKEKAEAMVAAVEGGAEFDAIAKDYVSEASKEAYSTEDYTLRSNMLGSNLSTVYQSWLQDAARKQGDVTSFENAGNGYVVIQFVSRGRDDTDTVDVRHILITPETSEGATESTEAQWAAAQTEAQTILDQYLAGEKTAEAFGALAEEHSDDNRTSSGALSSAGGAYTNVQQGDMVEEFDNWIFDSARAEGDTGLVKTQYGWHVMYFEGRNLPAWQTSAQSSMVNDAVNTWVEEKIAALEVVEAAGMAYMR